MNMTWKMAGAFALAALAYAAAPAADATVVAETLLADGSTNAWTRADLVRAHGLLNRRYRREVGTEAGRVRWHGRRTGCVEDMTNLVQTLTYEDGTSFAVPFRRQTMTVEQRFAAERRKRELAERRRRAGLPPRLRETEDKRRANAATTNEVTVTFGPGGAR